MIIGMKTIQNFTASTGTVLGMAIANKFSQGCE